MLKELQRALWAGAGLVALGTTKLRDLTDDLVKAGHLTEREGRKFLAKAETRARKAEAELEKRVEHVLHRVLRALDIPTRQDLNRLEKLVKARRRRGA